MKDFFGLKKIWSFVRPYKILVIWMVILGAFVSLVDTIFPLFNRYALNHFVGEQTLDTLPVFIAGYVIIILLQGLANYVNVYYCGKVEMGLDRDLRNAAFAHLQELSFSYFNQNNVGYIHARVMSDTGKIGELVAWDLMNIVWYGSYIIFAVIMMLSVNVKLALCVMIVIPVAVFIISIFEKKLIALNRATREMNSVITSDFNEGITGAKSIKTLVIEQGMTEGFESDTEKMRHLSVRTGSLSALFAASVTFLSSAALAIVLWKGGRLTMDGVIMLGTLSVFMTYALGLIEPVQNIISTISVLIGVQVNIERFTNLMNTEPDVLDSDEIKAKYGDAFNPKKENWEKLYGDVEFRNVDFKYPDGQEMVLEKFNLKVPQGSSIAIVGETGAGKSTLVNLVCRFFEPTNGQVLIDGRDVRERSQLWLHSNIGYVLQSPHLFSGSVRDNLRYGKPDATDEEIWDALKLVSADYVIDKMGNGLGSDVGEGGDMLSTGEKQLLSFARALIADPAILVLDEATSSIDTVTEKLIQDAIATVIKGRTSFVIAHRLSTIVDSDRILVVRDGKIIEQGTHQELMAMGGYYHSLYTQQLF